MSGHQMGLLTLRDADGAEYDVAVVFGDVLYRKGSTEERPITDLQSLKASVVAVRIVEAHPFGTLDVGATAAGPLDAPSGEGEPVSHKEETIPPHLEERFHRSMTDPAARTTRPRPRVTPLDD